MRARLTEATKEGNHWRWRFCGYWRLCKIKKIKKNFNSLRKRNVSTSNRKLPWSRGSWNRDCHNFGKTTCKDFKRTGDYLYSIVSKSLKSNLIVLSYHTLEFRNPIKKNLILIKKTPTKYQHHYYGTRMQKFFK